MKATPRISGMAATLAIGLFCCVSAVAPKTLLWSGRFLLPKELVLELTALVGAVWLLRRPDRAPREPAAALLLAGWAWGAVSLLAARPVLDDGLRAVGVLTAGCLVFLVTRALPDGRACDSHTGRQLVRAAIVATAAALAAMVVGEALGLWRVTAWTLAPAGPMGNRNRAAHILAVTLPVLWLTVRTAHTRFTVTAALAASVIAGWALVLSRTRGAWLACLCCAAYGLAMSWWTPSRPDEPRRRRPTGRTIGFVAALGVGALLAVFVPNALDWVEDSPRHAYMSSLHRLTDYRRGSGRGRIVQYVTTLRIVADHPLLGVGPGHWPAAYARYASEDDPSLSPVLPRPVDRVPQQDALALASELGTPAAMLVALAILIMFRRVRSDARALTDQNERLQAEAFGAALLLTVILGALNALVITPAGAFTVAMVLGSLAPGAGGRRWPAAIPRSGRAVLMRRTLRRGAPLLLLVMAIVTLLTLVATTRVALATHLVGNWMRPPTSLRRLDLAVALAPGDYDARFVRARYLVSRKRCPEAMPDLAAARAIFPGAPALEALWQACTPRAQ